MNTIVPPHDNILEKQVIGFCLYNLESALQVLQSVNKDDFYNSDNRFIYKIISEIINDGNAADVMAIVRRIQQSEADIPVSYITDISSNYGFTASGLDIAIKDLKSMSTMRKIKKVAEDALYGLKTGVEGNVLLSSLESGVMSLADEQGNARTKHISEVTEYVETNYEKFSQTEYTSGIPTLDDKIMWHNGLMYIIAGKPSSGKSTFSMQLMMHIQKQVPVFFFSIEMTAEMVNYRMAHRLGKYAGLLGYRDGSAKLRDMNIFIDDTPGLTVTQLRSKVLTAIYKYKAKAFFLDYVQLMDDPGKDKTVDKMMSVSKAITKIAKETKTIWFVLSQITKHGMDKAEPSMADLKETSQLIQDARGIYFIVPSNEEPSVVTFKCDKQNFGQGTWREKLYFDKAVGKFAALSKEPEW